MPTETLKETKEAILRQMKFNIAKLHESDKMTQTIARSDRAVCNALGEENVAGIVAKMIESVPVFSKDSKGYDVLSEASSSFSFKSLREAMYDLEDQGKLREVEAESMFGGLLRLGVTNLIAKAFQMAPLVWDKVLMVAPVKGLFGVYGSTFRPGLPDEVGAGEEFPESAVTPMDDIRKVKKWGSTFQIQNELLEDDQTGEMTTKVSETGENMRLYQELSFAAYLSNTPLTEGALTITPPVYTDPDGSTGVYSAVTTGVQRYRQNRPAAFGMIGMNTLRDARAMLKRMRQPNGVKIPIIADTLVYHPDDEQTVDILLKSPVYPASTGLSILPGVRTGQVNAINPLTSYGYNPIQCYYLQSGGSDGGAWFLGKAKSRSLIYQNRDGLQTIQESPNAGKSFDRDLSRWRNRSRGSFEWILGGARFWIQGNDGL